MSPRFVGITRSPRQYSRVTALIMNPGMIERSLIVQVFYKKIVGDYPHLPEAIGVFKIFCGHDSTL